MNIHQTEQEQLEQIKQWFQRNGLSLLATIALTFLIVYGIRHWQYLQERSFEHASVRYEQLLTSVAQNDHAAILEQANYLIRRYPNSSYAKLAGLLLARAEIYENHLDRAVDQLRGIANSAEVPAFRQIARIRLARVLLAQNQAKEALNVLKVQDDPDYQASSLEAKGDVLTVLGDTTAARDAYTEALRLLPSSAAIKPLLQMKLDNLN